MVDPQANAKRRHSSSEPGTSSSRPKYSCPSSATPAQPMDTNYNTKFSRSLDKFIDMEQIEISYLRGWVRQYLDIHHRESALILEEIVFDRLTSEKWPDPKVLQIELSDVFMEHQDARKFVKKLWEKLDKDLTSHSRHKRLKMG